MFHYLVLLIPRRLTHEKDKQNNNEFSKLFMTTLLGMIPLREGYLSTTYYLCKYCCRRFNPNYSDTLLYVLIVDSPGFISTMAQKWKLTILPILVDSHIFCGSILNLIIMTICRFTINLYSWPLSILERRVTEFSIIASIQFMHTAKSSLMPNSVELVKIPELWWLIIKFPT